jgi:hypothetical protein
VSEYPRQPLPPEGWPTQPPLYSNPGGQGGQGGQAWQAGFGQTAPYESPYGPNTFGQGGFDDGNPRGSVLQNGYGQAGYSDYGPRAPRRRRRGRGWIGLLITLIVLAVALVIGDQFARSYAQNMIAAKFQTAAGMSSKPSVTIEGFPFLTQVAAHDIRVVDISASNVPAGKIALTSVKAKAIGVHLSSGFNSATIDHISGTALVTYASLVSASGAQGVTITADPAAGPNAADVSVGPFTATASVTQTGPNRITVKMDSLGGIAASLVGQLPDYTFVVPPLPAGLQLRGVAVTDQGIVVTVAAQHTTLSQ